VPDNHDHFITTETQGSSNHMGHEDLAVQHDEHLGELGFEPSSLPGGKDDGAISSEGAAIH
jgi:hypothetical protein